MTALAHSPSAGLTASHAARAQPVEDDLGRAEGLILDLVALLDAGVVVIHERVLGPARYGVSPDLDDAA
jgi:hypothetical protein